MAGPSVLLALFVCLSACFQGMPAAQETKVIESFHVKSDIRFRLATTQIESVVRNTADKAQEIFFDVTLPKEAFIVSFSMEIDGKVYKGEVKEKTEAKKTYTDAVERGHTAGHIKQAARHANVFEVSVNVANGSAATFSLTYQEMLRRKLNMYQHEVHISPGQAVKDFLIEVFIQENRPLRLVKSPALQTGSLLTNKIIADDKISVVDRPSPNTAYMTYRPSLSDQGDNGLSARFIVEYDVEHSLKGDVLVVDGYFVHFFAPDVPPMPKDIVFILDVSGSMSGEKIQQLKDAMVVILGDLKPDDRFNIITFSSSVDKWQREFITATSEIIEKARTFIKSIVADGATNINSALVTGAWELKAVEAPERAGIIFFLTDGQATQGVTDSSLIAANIFDTNGNTSAIFGLAFGKSADYDLLTKISNQNSGFARKIYEDADAALQVASLYQEISAVSMKHLSFEYLPSSVDEYTVTNKKFPVILTGTEVVICGKMADKAEVFKMEVTGMQKSGPLNFVLEFENVTDLVIDAGDTANTFFTMPRDFSGIVEKMWAYVTIKQYLKEKEIHAANKLKVEELKTKIIQTAIKYKFVTPLTSMVVTKPESPEMPVESALQEADRPSHPQASRVLSGHKNMHDLQYYHYPLKARGRTIPDNIDISKSNAHASRKKMKQSARYTTKRPRPVNTATLGQLSAIRVETVARTVCLSPKKVKVGTYELLRTPKGTKLNIETACGGKKCKSFTFKRVVFENNGSRASLSFDQNKNLVYSTDLYFNVTRTNSDEIKVTDSQREFVVTITRSPNMGGGNVYFMDIQLSSLKGFKGFIGVTLNMRPQRRISGKHATAVELCKDESSGNWRKLTNTILARYKSAP